MLLFRPPFFAEPDIPEETAVPNARHIDVELKIRRPFAEALQLSLAALYCKDALRSACPNFCFVPLLVFCRAWGPASRERVGHVNVNFGLRRHKPTISIGRRPTEGLLISPRQPKPFTIAELTASEPNRGVRPVNVLLA